MKLQNYLINSLFLFSFLLYSCSKDDPVPVIEKLGLPSKIQLFDIDNNGDASDIRVFFNASSNFKFADEFRVILVKNTSISNFKLAQAEALTASSYHAVVTNSFLTKSNLLSDLMDSDNEPINSSNSYVGFVLAIANSDDIENVLSSPSNNFQLRNLTLNDLYISSRNSNSVELFDGVTGEYIKSFVSSGSGGLGNTQEVLFGRDGALYVSGRGNNAIKKYNGQTGAYISDFTKGYTLDNPTKMNYGPDGHLYVSQWGQTKNAVVRFDTTTGEFIDEVIASYFQGMDHVWDGAGNLYVTSWGEANVKKYDNQGNFVETLIGSSNLTGPVNLWIRGSDLFVVDWTEGNVKIFDLASGSFESIFISGFSTVEGHVFDKSGNLFLCDWTTNVIKKFNGTTGIFISNFITSDKIQSPNSITLGPNHKIQ